MIGLILAPLRNFSQRMGGMFSEIYEIVEIEISNKIETIKESQFFFQIYISFILLCNIISLLTIYGFMKVNQFKNQRLELSVHYSVIFKLLQCLLLPNKIKNLPSSLGYFLNLRFSTQIHLTTIPFLLQTQIDTNSTSTVQI
jgi:hypothetical protein